MLVNDQPGFPVWRLSAILDMSHSDKNANGAPREGTRPTSALSRCRPRALTRRSTVWNIQAMRPLDLDMRPARALRAPSRRRPSLHSQMKSIQHCCWPACPLRSGETTGDGKAPVASLRPSRVGNCRLWRVYAEYPVCTRRVPHVDSRIASVCRPFVAVSVYSQCGCQETTVRLPGALWLPVGHRQPKSLRIQSGDGN